MKAIFVLQIVLYLTSCDQIQSYILPTQNPQTVCFQLKAEEEEVVS